MEHRSPLLAYVGAGMRNERATLASTSEPLVLAGTWDPTATVVQYLNIVGVLAATPGLAYLASVTINIHGNSPGTSNLSLPGDAPLTTSGTISGSVAAHP